MDGGEIQSSHNGNDWRPRQLEAGQGRFRPMERMAVKRGGDYRFEGGKRAFYRRRLDVQKRVASAPEPQPNRSAILLGDKLFPAESAAVHGNAAAVKKPDSDFPTEKYPIGEGSQRFSSRDCRLLGLASGSVARRKSAAGHSISREAGAALALFGRCVHCHSLWSGRRPSKCVCRGRRQRLPLLCLFCFDAVWIDAGNRRIRASLVGRMVAQHLIQQRGGADDRQNAMTINGKIAQTCWEKSRQPIGSKGNQ